MASSVVTHSKDELGKSSIRCEQGGSRCRVKYYLPSPLLPTPYHYGGRTSFGLVYPCLALCSVNTRQIETLPDRTLGSLYWFPTSASSYPLLRMGSHCKNVIDDNTGIVDTSYWTSQSPPSTRTTSRGFHLISVCSELRTVCCTYTSTSTYASIFRSFINGEANRLLHVTDENAGAFGVESSDNRAEMLIKMSNRFE